MKKLLLALLLVLSAAVGYAQPGAPSSGRWVIVDTTYQVGTQTLGVTKSKLYYANTTSNKISGLQFRVYYDKVAFGGAKPTVALMYSATDQYLQYVADSVNGNITVTLVYTGSSSTFSYADGAAVEITFTHAPPATFQYLTSIDSMKITGTLTYPNMASTINGNDTSLNMYSYGGAFKLNRLKYRGKFTNVTGSGTKNLTVALEKRVKGTSGSWTPVNVATTDTAGKFAFDVIMDTTYWDAHLYVKGDTMGVYATVSVADAQKVNQFVLGTATPTGFDYYSADVNGSNSISIADVYSIYGRLAGRFSTWPNSVQDVKFFTATEFSTINGSSTNYTSSISGVTNLVFDIVAGQPDSITFYTLGKGDANGTGFHMARITPIEIINPSNAPKYIIDETVNYDFPTATIEVNMPQITVDAGNLVNVPVKVLTNGGQVGSVQLAFAYDNSLLEFKGIETEQKFMNWMSFLNPNNGIVEWAGADMSKNENLANDGDKIMNLQFTALQPQTNWSVSPLYVIRKFAGNGNATDLSITPTNGVIKIFRLANPKNGGKDAEISVFPNPTNGPLTVTFTVPEDDIVSVGFYDNNGILIRTVYTGKMYKGTYTYTADIANHTDGVYYGILTTQNAVKSNKIIKVN
jgi:hypothetical protein